MRRDDSGRRIVTAKSAVGMTLLGVLGAVPATIALLSWLGVPSPAAFTAWRVEADAKIGACATKEQVDDLSRQFDELRRLLASFQITAEARDQLIRDAIAREHNR